MHTTKWSFGPRLVAHPTGALRAAILVAPEVEIESARPLPGEPNAVYTRALTQHGILAKTLRYFGTDVTVLGAHTRDPYASAVVDAALAFENGAVMMRPASMSRRAEVAWLESEFEKRDVPIAGHIATPGLIDGSDVLMAGNTAFIGVNANNNAFGRAGFKTIAQAHGFDVIEVRLGRNASSLRAVAGVVARDTLVVGPSDRIDHSPLSGFKSARYADGRRIGRRRAEPGRTSRAGRRALSESDRHVAQKRHDRRSHRFVRLCAHWAEPLDAGIGPQAGVTGVRIAICSDIHGNLVGLDACLADLQHQGGADVVVAAGDLCMDGPRPKKVLQRLNEIGAQCLRGNTDRYIAASDERDLHGCDESDRRQVEWQRKEIGEKWLKWLRELPFSLRFGEGENELLVVHANPTSDDEHLWPDADEDTLSRLIGNEGAGTIAFGHLHIPYVRSWRGKLLVNVSSSGLPKDGDPRAGYALLTLRPGGWEVKHRRVAFDVKKVATQLADCGIPESADLITTLRRHRYKRLKTLVP